MKLVHLRSLIFAAVCPLLLMVCVSAQTSAPSPEVWTSVRSKNFFLIGDAAETDIRMAATRLEQFRAAFGQLFSGVKLDGRVGTNVVVFKNAASFRPFKPRRPDGSPDDAIAGFFQPGQDVNYITLSIGYPQADPYKTIFHEYVHFLLDVNYGARRLPPWLNEGLAEYYETLKVLDDRRISLGGGRPEHLQQLRQKGLLPFAQFFAAESSTLHHNGDQARSQFYAQAWAVVHLLLQSDRAKGAENINKFLALAANKQAPEAAFRQAFGFDFAGLEKALREHIALAAHLAAIAALPNGVAVDSQMTTARLTQAETQAYLGDLLYHNNRLPEAEERLQQALKLNSRLAKANISLGLLYARQEKNIEAKRFLESGLTSDRTNHYALFNLAYLISLESVDPEGNVSRFPAAAAARMRELLRRSVELDPDFAESYRLLAFIDLVNNESLDQAARLASKAVALEPENQEYALLLAQILLQQERYGEAKAIAVTLVDANPQPAVRADAENIIRTVDKYVRDKDSHDDAPKLRLFGVAPPLILKRSTLTDQQIAAIEEDRVLMNLNIMLQKPRAGEKQVLGYIERVTCTPNGIIYTIRASEERLSLTGREFGDLRLSVLTEGENSYEIGCDVGFAKHLTVLTFEPSVDKRSAAKGRLVAITFVPDNFRFKTPDEMASYRTVIIEDDRLFQKSNSARP